MITLVFLMFVNLFVDIFIFLIIARVVMSLISYFTHAQGPMLAGIVAITEPILAPVRRILPATPGIDFAPWVTFFLLQALQYGVNWLFGMR